MVWLPWKPHGDEEAGLKLGRLKPGQARGRAGWCRGGWARCAGPRRRA